MFRSFWALLALVTVVGLAVGAGLAAATSRGPVGNTTAAGAPASGAAARLAASSASDGTNARPGGSGVDGANARPGGGTAAFANRRTVAGTVEQVDGQKLVVKSDGGSVPIALNDQTAYRKMVTGGLDDLKAGETLVAQTETGADGALVARSLQLGPAAGGQAAMLQLAAGVTGGSAGAGGGRRGEGANAGASRMTIGTIQTADGKTITLTTPAGPVKLTIADGAEIRRSDAATRDDLKPGQTVTVVEQPGTAGGSSPAAVAVTIGSD